MVQLQLKSDQPKPHFLTAKKDLIGFKCNGQMKECYIVRYSDNRFAVFARMGGDYFYHVSSDEKQLNETFNEQLSI